MNWYLGAKQLPSYFQLTETVVITHNDTCGNVKESLQRNKKNLIIMCTFLLGRVFLSSVSDTLSVQKKKKMIKMKVHQKIFFPTSLRDVLTNRNIEHLLKAKCTA